MKIHRFLYPHLIEGTTHILTESELVHQINRVLKLEEGENIELFDGQGTSHSATLDKVSKNEITLTITNVTLHKKAPRDVVLFVSILKKENTELAIEKAVEIGVSQIIPIITSRTIKTGIKTERIHSIIKEATEQSGRTYLPQFHDSMDFADAIIFAKNNFARVVLFDPRGTPFIAKNESSVAVFVGPEGGFTDEELSVAKETGIEICSLPTHILRGETAVIVGVYSALL
jgi:16S rRNA (uracil1498-N3)-methyltransferase